ncbi:4620_t:CDS:2 [Paraglomus occultum]|uniref:4620_t:CDS:1 n=1 Tax=Paraglomus occultum TaxID=144539 RepID=A0A9N8W8E9_9GLOM|nr:4620_t:CDS:2 [Paraglomus occultum]
MSYDQTTTLASSSARPLLPSYDEALASEDDGENQSLLQTDYSKTSYTDTNVVVDIHGQENAMTDEFSAPPAYSLSDASYERSNEGVVSHDSKINKDIESLHRFFLAHNDMPEMAITIHGYHEETTVHYHTHTDANGHTRTDTTHDSREVTDFHFTLDLTEYIIPRGMITVCGQKGQPAKDLRELLQEYIDHKNKLKEIKMKKVVVWDYTSLTRAITYAIRQQGYHNQVRVTFPMRNHMVEVYDDNKLSRFAHSKWTRFLCFISCLWIIFLPLSWLYKKSFNRQIESMFVMKITPREWFNANVNTIVNNVRWV